MITPIAVRGINSKLEELINDIDIVTKCTKKKALTQKLLLKNLTKIRGELILLEIDIEQEETQIK